MNRNVGGSIKVINELRLVSLQFNLYLLNNCQATAWGKTYKYRWQRPFISDDHSKLMLQWIVSQTGYLGY